jgi:hypothetical protein
MILGTLIKADACGRQIPMNADWRRLAFPEGLIIMHMMEPRFRGSSYKEMQRIAESRRAPWRFLFPCLYIFYGGSLAPSAPAPHPIPLEIPRPVDPRLEITLYADAPEIVTPIGAAVDSRGRLFVIESHTHLAPGNYKGPKRDRIKIFEGVGVNGRAARVGVFADQVLEGMNLAFAPDGVLYVCTAKTVEALPDRDDDGVCDGSKVVLRRRPARVGRVGWAPTRGVWQRRRYRALPA